MSLLVFLVAVASIIAVLVALYRWQESRDGDEDEEIDRDMSVTTGLTPTDVERAWLDVCHELIDDPQFLSDIHLALEESPRWPQT